MDYTIDQSSEDQRRSQELSLGRNRPPAEAPGYEPIRFLGAGAYGEVWVAYEKNTGRQVAIKYYTHKGGLDWTLLHREVEKLVFLAADRYVVQLIAVGWDSDPPYYIMEYVETGSLEDRLRRQGPMPLEDAVFSFREIAVGLSHAHGKGVLHCDLKPANILMDQDGRPRLADFGQSRLSHEQAPSLGTLFYMAPEQADLSASPDARWDVYGLGGLLYCMLVGRPPRRSEAAIASIEKEKDLESRLKAYQKAIYEAPPLRLTAEVKGCDKPLSKIVEKCLEVDPRKRFANVQAVLDALAERARQRAWRPLWLLGAILPALMLSLGSLFVWSGIEAAVRETDRALTERALRSNRFAAEYVAEAAADSLRDRFRELRQVSTDQKFVKAMRLVGADKKLSTIRTRLRDPQTSEAKATPLRAELRLAESLNKLQSQLLSLTFVDPVDSPLGDEEKTSEKKRVTGVRSWFVTDERGLQIARNPASDTIGRRYAHRSYFHGGPENLPEDREIAPDQHVKEAQISSVYQSESTKEWTVALSTPIYDSDQKFLGVLGLSLEVGKIVTFKSDSSEFPVLVDMRPGKRQGLILQHPSFHESARLHALDLSSLVIPASGFPSKENPQVQSRYQDPVETAAQGKMPIRYLAAAQSVNMPDAATGDPIPTGLAVIVQQSYQESVGGTLSALRSKLLVLSGAAAALLSLVVAGLWLLVTRVGRFAPDFGSKYFSEMSSTSGATGQGATVDYRPQVKAAQEAAKEVTGTLPHQPSQEAASARAGSSESG